MPVNTPLANLETGVMFWANREPGEVVAELRDLGVRCGQLGLPGELGLACAPAWKAALSDSDFTVYTVFASFIGESYADIPTVKDTVGLMPRRYREEREQRTFAVSDFAKAIGCSSVGLHIGCVPDDDSDEDYVAVREMVRRVADHAAANGQSLALETGQETAEALRSFLIDVNRDNVGINFDPANMILYGTGDPIAALGVLAQRVLSVHCKDGDWPPADKPGALGTERALGSGAVGIERYLQALQRIGYTGPLAVEREAEDPEERLRDIKAAIALLEQVKSTLR